MLVATVGDKLAGIQELSTTLASTSLNKGSLEFTLPCETKVSLGVLYNLPAYSSSAISEFSLSRLACEIIPAKSGELTAVDNVSTSSKNVKVQVRKGAVVLDGQNEMVRVYTVDGRLVQSFLINGTTTISWPQGIYLINGNKVRVQ